MSLARQQEALLAAAEAVLASFQPALDHGALNRHQHSALRLLEAALYPYGRDNLPPAAPLADRQQEQGERLPTPPELPSANSPRFIGVDQGAGR